MDGDEVLDLIKWTLIILIAVILIGWAVSAKEIIIIDQDNNVEVIQKRDNSNYGVKFDWDNPSAVEQIMFDEDRDEEEEGEK